MTSLGGSLRQTKIEGKKDGMNYRDEFLRIMDDQTDMALATCVSGVPNVRIVNFLYDSEEKAVYFATFKDNDKMSEMTQSPTVAFTTCPKEGNAHVRAHGTAQRSDRSIRDLADAFCAKVPDYRETIEYGGASLVLYEIRCAEVLAVADLTQSGKIEL